MQVLILHKIHYLPESGNELKSPHNNNWILFVSGLCPGRKLWLASSKILRSSLDSIMVWINLTSQNSGSQCIWAVHTKMGWCTWLASGGSPDVRCKNYLAKSLLLTEQLKHYIQPTFCYLREAKLRYHQISASTCPLIQSTVFISWMNVFHYDAT